MPELEFEKNILGQREIRHFISRNEYKTKSKFELLEEINWDFKDAKTQYLTHRFHSYPARFIPQIPRTFIKLFTKKGDTILDPFCGCGTTLVESQLLGRHSFGNDLNPLATLISKVKTTSISARKLNGLVNFLDRIEREIKKNNRKLTLLKLPNRNISKLFTKEMLEELQVIKENINELEDKALFNLLLVALSSTIRAIIESENGDNIFQIFKNKVNMMADTIKEYDKYINDNIKVSVITGDSRRLKDIGNNSVDLIVTSPPYVNALDYYRVHMYNMLWLGMNYSAFKQNEIGGHSHHIFNRFRLLSEYLGDMLRSMIEMNRVMKKGKICAIVVGNSSIDYELIESYKHFVNMAKFIGFGVKKTIFRNIDKSAKYFVNGKIDDEFIVVLEKARDSQHNYSDDDFIAEIVRNELKVFREKVKKSPGSSTRGKKVTMERLRKNVFKIDEAIKNVKKDIKFKEV
jgi:DNA modification methylase